MPISPLEGEMPGRAEGGETATIVRSKPLPLFGVMLDHLATTPIRRRCRLTWPLHLP